MDMSGSKLAFHLVHMIGWPDFDKLTPAQQVDIRRSPGLLNAQQGLYRGRYIFADPALNDILETLIMKGYLLDEEVYE